jgi:hypothetical protein
MAVGREIRLRRLTTIKILNAEPLHRSLDVIHPRRRPLRPEAQAFLRIVREAAKEAAFAGNPHRGRSRV